MKSLFPRAAFVLACIGAGVAPAMADLVYNNIPDPLPVSLPSLGYEAEQTVAFGGLIGLTSASSLTSATLYMDTWAPLSDLAGYATYQANQAGNFDANGYQWPLTLSLYNVTGTGASTAAGSLITSVTQTFTIPWRPPTDPVNCTGGRYQGPDGNCYHGFGFEVKFDLSGVSVPDNLIYSLSFNTADYGDSPVGYAGPYNSLNFGVATTGAGVPSVGTDPLPGSVFWNTTNASWFGTAGSLALDNQDTANWGAGQGTWYEGALALDAAPEPAAFGFGAMGIAAVALMNRLRRGRKA